MISPLALLMLKDSLPLEHAGALPTSRPPIELPPALHRNLVVERGCMVIGRDHGALHAIISCAVCDPVSPSCRLEGSTGLSSRAARDGVLCRSSDRRPRTGGARREHRHARGAGAAGWRGHAPRCRPTRAHARRDTVRSPMRRAARAETDRTARRPSGRERA
jgi:hypothetical protein